MEAFLVSLSSVAIAEMGDRTQLLSLMLAARYRKPLPILAGVLLATILNHAAAGAIGALFGRFLTPAVLDAVVGASLLGMALWTLKPDTLDDDQKTKDGTSIFLTTFVTFFVAEIGDKTQIAVVALAAAYANLVAVVLGSTLGMMAANTPVVFLGDRFARRLPLRALNIGASLLFAVLGIVFIVRAVHSWT